MCVFFWSLQCGTNKRGELRKLRMLATSRYETWGKCLCDGDYGPERFKIKDSPSYLSINCSCSLNSDVGNLLQVQFLYTTSKI